MAFSVARPKVIRSDQICLVFLYFFYYSIFVLPFSIIVLLFHSKSLPLIFKSSVTEQSHKENRTRNGQSRFSWKIAVRTEKDE